MFLKKRKFKKLVSTSEFFDSAFYSKEYADVKPSGVGAVEHYCNIGVTEDRKPNQDFDPIWYKKFYGTLNEKANNPFLHFLSVGIKDNNFINETEALEYKRLVNSPEFDEGFYKNLYSDLKAQPKTFDYLLHYIRYGNKEGRKASDKKIIPLKTDIANIVEPVKSKASSTKTKLDLGPTIKAIKESGSFDTDYYLKTYPDIAANAMDPILHYLMFGWEEGRNPSDMFNTSYYLAAYEDVAASGMNPFFHWLQFGKKEGRLTNPYVQTEMSAFSDIFLADQTKIKFLTDSVFDAKYYLETNADVKQAGIDPLEHFISYGVFEKRNPSSSFDISYYLNNNFGLHAKKMNPIEHFIEIGIKQGYQTKDDCNNHDQTLVIVLNNIKVDAEALNYLERIRAFKQNDYNIKVIVPEFGELVPYLRNFAEVLCLKTSEYFISPDCPSNFDFIQSFVGFEVKAVCFTSMVDLKLARKFNTEMNAPLIIHLSEESYNKDFPFVLNELQFNTKVITVENEGILEKVKGNELCKVNTILIENPHDYKSVPLIEANSLKIIKELCNIQAQQTTLESWQETQKNANEASLYRDYLASSENELHYINDFANKIENVEIVSFDIFDTLLERTVLNPHDVFTLVAEQAKADGLADIDFRAYRVEAELDARKRSEHEEVTIDEIYSSLQVQYDIEDLTLSGLKKLELEVEEKVLVVKPFGKKLLELAQKNNKKVLLISDMYLDRKFIADVVRKNGIKVLNKDLFVSSELRLTKHSGKLFSHILENNEKLTPWLHVGDNLHSDIAMPHSLGIQSFYIKHSAKAFFEVNQLEKPAGLSTLVELSHQTISETIARKLYGANRLKHTSQFLGDGYNIGFETLGPIFTGFLNYLNNLLKENNYKKLFFVSRDGYFLKVAYELLRQNDSTLPISYYFLSSRLLSYSSSFTDKDSVSYVANKDYFPTTLRHLLSVRFNFDDAMFSASENLLSSYGFNTFDDSVIQHENHNNFYDFVMNFQQEIIHKNNENKNNFIEYIDETGLDENSLIVDIGYAGSLQTTLFNLTAKKVDAAYFITNEKVTELATNGLKHHAYIDYNQDVVSSFFKYVQLFELFFSATHPSVIGLSKNSDSFKPVYDTTCFTDNTNKMLARLHKGAIDFVDCYLEQHYDVFTELKQYDHNAVLTNALNFFEKPAAEDCQLFNEIIFEDRFGANYYPLITRDLEKLKMDDETLLAHGVWAGASRALKEKGNTFSEEETSGGYVDLLDEKGQLLPFYTNDEFKTLGELSSLTGTRPFFNVLIIADDIDVPKFIEAFDEQYYEYWNVTFIFSQDIENYLKDKITYSEKYHYSINFDNIDLSAQWTVFADGAVSFERSFLVETCETIRNSAAEVIYYDEAELVNGESVNHQFRPDLSPELLISQPYYTGSVICCKTHQLTLQEKSSFIIPKTVMQAAINNIVVKHIPKVLFNSLKSVKRVDYVSLVEDYLAELGIEYSEAYEEEYSKSLDAPVYSVKFPNEGPEVAIVIPTKNMFDVLKVCLDSLENTTYKNYTVYIINNDSDEEDILGYFAETKHQVLNISSVNGVFSYSYVNNEAAKLVKEDYVLFLNNDIKVITPDWLSQMIGLMQIDGVGSVGARLYYGNDKLQHVGITNNVAPYGLPAPSFKLIAGDEAGYLNYAKSIKNFSAMTAACMLTSKKAFFEMGGFDDVDFSVAYNDCDFGFKLTQAGYRNVVASNAELYHYEGVTRGIGVGNDKPSEESSFIRKYKNWDDPFYNPNLTISGTDFSIRNTMIRTMPDQRIRCLMVSHNYEFEGAPLIQYEVAKALKADYLIEPVILSPQDGPLRELYEKEGIETHCIESFNLFDSSTSLEYENRLWELHKAISDIAPNVVYANTILSYWAIEIAKELNIPSLWAIHESEPPFEHLRDFSKLIESKGKPCINHSYKNIFVAESTKQLFEPFNLTNNYEVIHNGFDSSRVKVERDQAKREQLRKELEVEDKFIFICPGIVSKRKSQIDAIRAFEKLPEKMKSNIAIMIVGDRQSAYSDELHQYLQQSDIVTQSNVKVIQETSEIATYYNAADAFLFTSHLESFPKVIQEAMYLQLPIVSTNTFGIKEQVFHGSSALLCAPGDIDKLSLHIQQVYADKTLRLKLIENAISALDKLPTYKEMVAGYNELIQQTYLSIK